MGVAARAVALTLLGALLGGTVATGQPQFREQTIATGLKGGYQVLPVDLNRDGRLDLIALSSGLKELEWYENPGRAGAEWPRHVIAGGLNRMINVVAQDLDGDGYPELVVAHEFANEASKSAGIVSVIRATEPGNPLAPWRVQEIDRLTTSHRLRTARIGEGRQVVVNAPLTGANAAPPEYADNVPLVLYDPRHEMKRELIGDQNRGVVHGILVTDWNRDGRSDEILTASFSGIHIYDRQADGVWRRTEFSREPSSDIAVGRGPKGRRFLATIEPWHGNRVVVYDAGSRKRTVIDESLVDGHTILAADFDGDGQDEIVAGCRGGSRAVYLYHFVQGAWKRQPVDVGGVSAAACIAADFDGDQRPDLACIGSATANLKLYQNFTSAIRPR